MNWNDQLDKCKPHATLISQTGVGVEVLKKEQWKSLQVEPHSSYLAYISSHLAYIARDYVVN